MFLGVVVSSKVKNPALMSGFFCVKFSDREPDGYPFQVAIRYGIFEGVSLWDGILATKPKRS